MKLVIGGIKGGTGKTTIATNFAYMRSSAGKKVLLVDADEQKSASAWSDQRAGMQIQSGWTTIQLSGMYLYEEILKLSKLYDDIIIDTGGRDNSSQRSALTVADIFLMPFRPKAFDVWTLGQVNNLLSLAKASNPKLITLAVINQSDVNGIADVEEAKDIISECNITCLTHSIGTRRSFGNAATEGLSVMELSSEKKNWIQKAQQEMQQLYDSVYSADI
jgi:chromosome partitioning protein